ncbi:hypothetical protein A0H76_2270 [Hepatospora eriocheir]|uniref:Uncharacterized protein n=1 Tax=Hepatospora eriocheir TaxID=1081669 RepID=A0A1X0QFQ5_9MICR|nr:hypothetical protein A0H76_2270 [Hepatospora eriocheir]
MSNYKLDNLEPISERKRKKLFDEDRADEIPFSYEHGEFNSPNLKGGISLNKNNNDLNKDDDKDEEKTDDKNDDDDKINEEEKTDNKNNSEEEKIDEEEKKKEVAEAIAKLADLDKKNHARDLINQKNNLKSNNTHSHNDNKNKKLKDLKGFKSNSSNSKSSSSKSGSVVITTTKITSSKSYLVEPSDNQLEHINLLDSFESLKNFIDN